MFANYGVGPLFLVTPDPSIETPYEIAMQNDEKLFWANRLKKKLSKLENSVFQNFLRGKSYHQIADMLGVVSIKTIDNALIRAREKAQSLLSRYNARTYC